MLGSPGVWIVGLLDRRLITNLWRQTPSLSYAKCCGYQISNALIWYIKERHYAAVHTPPPARKSVKFLNSQFSAAHYQFPISWPTPRGVLIVDMHLGFSVSYWVCRETLNIIW